MLYRGWEKQDLVFPLAICYKGVEKKQDLVFSLALCYSGVEKEQDPVFSLALYVIYGLRKTRSCVFPTPLYRGWEETRSCFFSTAICYIGVEKQISPFPFSYMLDLVEKKTRFCFLGVEKKNEMLLFPYLYILYRGWEKSKIIRVSMAWKSHGKWFLFSRPGIVTEFAKKWQRS